MIDYDSLFDEIKSNMALVCPDDGDTSDLVHVADAVIGRKIPMISVPPESVEVLWAWLEKKPTKIVARFIMDDGSDKKKHPGVDVSKLSMQINTVFKKGADGVQIFIPYSQLNEFVLDLSAIRDDLFFNKDLSIGLDINEINESDWDNVFSNINTIRANSLLFVMSTARKSKQDFVGRIYGLLNLLESDFDAELHFMLGDDYEKIEQIWRLVQKVRPDMLPKVQFFVGN